ncbi:MAG: aspartate-alanine antiporter [Muribaculaceae bacterium]|nr:aspartate-alanine antiporter [Muribaculaceae bacterium]
MHYFIDILREYPVIALFLTVGLGFLFGRFKIKGFSLGSVTCTLLVGILIGQLGIQVSGQIKTAFFMLFLFSIGYSVGPGFFRSLRGIGLKQAGFAVTLGVVIFGVTVGLSHLFNYNAGETVGLFSGSQTCSSLIGVGSEAIQNSVLLPDEKTEQINMVPVCYAVTYVYGTLGTIIILSLLGPKLLGGLEKVKEETRRLQLQYSSNPWRDDPAYINAHRPVLFRTFALSNPEINGMTVKGVERLLREAGIPGYIVRLHHAQSDEIIDASSSTVLTVGDVVMVSGRAENLIYTTRLVGEETSDAVLLNFPMKQVPVLLRNHNIIDSSVDRLMAEKWMHGVTVKEIMREGKEIDFSSEEFKFESRDLITIVGPNKSVNKAASHLGHMDRPSIHTDIMFLCLALFVGGLFGAATIHFGNVPVSFGTGGGALLAGLIFGWVRSRRPSYGHIPKSVVWFLNQIGLTAFIAAVGLNCAPEFISGIKQAGWMLPIVGIIATSVPLLIGLWLGHKVFKFPAAFTLGCCAGTRTCTAALGAVQDTIDSTLPTIAYTITYAVSNILLIIWGLIAVILA